MKSFRTKLVLSVLGIAMLATPAFAQRPHRVYSHQTAQTDNGTVGVYPNPVGHSGSAEDVQSGAAWDLDRGY